MIRFSRMRLVMTLTVLACLFQAAAFGGPPPLSPAPGHLPEPERGALSARRDALVAERANLEARMKAHNAKSAPAGSPEAAELLREGDQLRADLQAHLSASKKFNEDVDAAVSAAFERAKQAEQDEFDRMNAAWMKKQEDLVRQAVAQDKAWRGECLAAIEEDRVPDPAHRPKAIADLMPGDVLLVTPDPQDWISRNIPRADWFYRTVGEFAEGDVFKAMETREMPISHALTFVRNVNGRLLFLDHTKVGSRMLDEKELTRLYGSRAMYVARPQAVVDGRKLWEFAREAAMKKRSDFGIRKGKVVCSTKAAIAVAAATGLDLHAHKLSAIDVTPADFFDPDGVGKYFLISPLKE